MRAIAAAADTLYLGGDFSTVGGASRLNAAAVSRTTGTPTPWNPSLSGGSGVHGNTLSLAVGENAV